MKKRISLLLSVWLAVSSALCGCNMVLQKNEKILFIFFNDIPASFIHRRWESCYNERK